MWNLTFETRTPAGYGFRSLPWTGKRLPTKEDILDLVMIDPHSFWFTIKGNANVESGPLDFVPLIILLDKHASVLEMHHLTIKIGHRNPFLSATEETANSVKTTEFIAKMRDAATGETAEDATTPKERRVFKAADNVEPKERQPEAPAAASGNSTQTKTETSSASRPMSPSQPLRLNGRKDIAPSATDNTAHVVKGKPAEVHSYATSEAWSDCDDILDHPVASFVLETESSQNVGQIGQGGEPTVAESLERLQSWCAERLGNSSAGQEEKHGLVFRSDKQSEAQAGIQTDSLSDLPKVSPDDIICKLPLRVDVAQAGTSTDKGKGKVKPRSSGYGISREEMIVSAAPSPLPISDDCTDNLTTATLSPATFQRTRSAYLEKLVNANENSNASSAVLRIIEDEGVDLESSLGMRLLDLAKYLRSDGAFVKSFQTPPGKEIKAADLAVRSARMLEQVLDKLNDHSGMLNAIAEASGVNLLDDDDEVPVSAPKKQPAPAPKAAVKPSAVNKPVDETTVKSHTAKPSTVSFSVLLVGAEMLRISAEEPLISERTNHNVPHPGVTCPIPVPAPTFPAPVIAICPPHPFSSDRNLRPLPDTQLTPPVVPAPGTGSTYTIGEHAIPPNDVNSVIWAKVQDFAKTSAEVRAKQHEEQMKALQAHILDMYRLSRTAHVGEAPVTSVKEQARPAQPVVAPETSASATDVPQQTRAPPTNLQKLRLAGAVPFVTNSKLPLTEAEERAGPRGDETHDLEYERYLHHVRNGPFAIPDAAHDPRFFHQPPAKGNMTAASGRPESGATKDAGKHDASRGFRFGDKPTTSHDFDDPDGEGDDDEYCGTSKPFRFGPPNAFSFGDPKPFKLAAPEPVTPFTGDQFYHPKRSFAFGPGDSQWEAFQRESARVHAFAHIAHQRRTGGHLPAHPPSFGFGGTSYPPRPNPPTMFGQSGFPSNAAAGGAIAQANGAASDAYKQWQGVQGGGFTAAAAKPKINFAQGA